tara:strand:+ start:1043 stop:1378 length:336 start_codon:yes stop_codon:yes gene_type:complete
MQDYITCPNCENSNLMIDAEETVVPQMYCDDCGMYAETRYKFVSLKEFNEQQKRFHDDVIADDDDYIYWYEKRHGTRDFVPLKKFPYKRKLHNQRVELTNWEVRNNGCDKG